jgi:predicted ATPase
MELLYVYIESYGCLKEQDFNLSGNHRFEYRDKKLQLVSNEQKVPKDFFGEHISNVSFLIGENGSGKTTFFRFLTQELIAGNDNRAIRFIAVFANTNSEEQNDDLTREVSASDEKVSVPFLVYFNGLDGVELDIPCIRIQSPPEENHIVTYSPMTDIGRLESWNSERIGNWVNLSDFALLRYDFEGVYYRDYRDLSILRFSEVSNLMRFTDIRREVELMANPLYNDFVVPRYVRVRILDPAEVLENILYGSIAGSKQNEMILSGADFLEALKFILTKEKLASLTVKGDLILSLAIEAFAAEVRGAYANFSLSEGKEGFILEEVKAELQNALGWFKAINLGDTDPVNWLKSFSPKAASGYLSHFAQFIELAVEGLGIIENDIVQSGENPEWSVFNTISGYPRYRYQIVFPIADNKIYFIQFIDWLSKISRYTRPITFDYLNSELQSYSMSMGESLRLKFFSRLVNVGLWKEIDQSLGRKSVILLLDEADLGLHPRWQQVFMADLLEFINKLVDKHFKSKVNVQVIIATHSPIFLSDIPSSNVIWLSKSDSLLKGSRLTSFAGNIFDLFNDNFFLNESFIGKFAEDKLSSLINYLTNSKEEGRTGVFDWDEGKARQVINMINEDVLRLSLEGLYDERFPQNDPDWIDRRIRELEALKKNQSNEKGL